MLKGNNIKCSIHWNYLRFFIFMSIRLQLSELGARPDFRTNATISHGQTLAFGCTVANVLKSVRCRFARRRLISLCTYCKRVRYNKKREGRMWPPVVADFPQSRSSGEEEGSTTVEGWTAGGKFLFSPAFWRTRSGRGVRIHTVGGQLWQPGSKFATRLVLKPEINFNNKNNLYCISRK